jgi:energy-coupling factor transporter ATP-binding protein EcfA2
MSISASINKELLEWFGELPEWQNEAFRRILTKGRLDVADYDEIYTCACRELGLETGEVPAPARLTENDLPTAPPAAGTPPRLVALSALQNVNLLPSNQRLEFGARLTIVYGGNAAGKSGYARVLKQACRCHEKAVERVLPNVYQTPVAGAVACANFDVEVSGSTQTVAWQEGNAANPLLRSFVVFDAKVARSYLTERNLATAIPPVFSKLELLGEAIGIVKGRLARASTAEQPAAIALSGYTDETVVGKLLAGVNGNTLRSALEETLVWSTEDEAVLTDLEQQHARLKTQGPEALKRILQQRRTRLTSLRNVLRQTEGSVAEVKVQAIKSQWQICKDLAEQKQAAATAALGKTVIEKVGSKAWEELLFAAAKFFVADVEPGMEFPGTADTSKCVLCQRVLDKVAHDRLQSFWNFLQDDLAQRLTAAQGKLEELLLPLEDVSAETPEELKVVGQHYAEEIPTIWSRVPGYFKALAGRHDAILTATKNGKWEDVSSTPPPLSAECGNEESAILEKETALGDPRQAATELTKLANNVRELTSRKRAAAARAIILDHLTHLVRAKQLRTAWEQVSTQSISMKTTTLQRKYVTEAFTARVRGEAQELGLKRALPDILSRTEAGKLSRSLAIEGLKVSGATPEQVFSEGERTALALAYFLAELGSAADVPGVIFDDPVTSLDHRIRSKVIAKIVGLAKDRQVIVLTHDLPFYCELKEAATQEKVLLELRAIEAIGSFVGLARNGEPIDAMGVVEREKVLEDFIKQAQQAEAAGHVDGFSLTCYRFYSLLRRTWERAVEELLFNKVVMRFEKNVKTQSLTGAVIDADSISLVFKAMSKCSAIIDAHDHAIAANATEPDSAEMKRDLEVLRAFRLEHKKKRSAQEEILKHLKG